MKIIISIFCAVIALSSIGCGGGGGSENTNNTPQQDNITSYRVRDLGVVDTNNGNAGAVAINSNNRIVIQSGNQVFISDIQGNKSELSLPQGGIYPEGADINDSGEVVGRFFLESASRAVKWKADGSAEILSCDFENSHSKAFYVNSSGLIAGVDRDVSAPSGTYQMRVWNKDGSVKYRLGSGITGGINDLGQVIGRTTDGHIVLWNANGSVVSSTALACDDPLPLSLNNNGVSIVQANEVSYLRNAAGSYTEILVAGHQYVCAESLNNHGRIVGTVDGIGSVDRSRAFTMNSNDQIILLDLPEDYSRSIALDINDSGYIVGYIEKPGGERHAALWIPE